MIRVEECHQAGFMLDKAIKQDSCRTRPSSRIHAGQGHEAGFLQEK